MSALRPLLKSEPDAQAVTIGQLLDAYLHEHLVRPATAETYRKAAHRWADETGRFGLDQVTRAAVVDWRNKVLARARPETWNKYRRHLRALFNYAVEREWMAVNPFRQVPPARTSSRLKKTVDKRLIVRAVAVLSRLPELDAGESGRLQPGWFWAMVLRAFYFTGVRRRQLVELRWADVDLVGRVWRIRAETSKTRREWILPLAAEVVADLEELRERITQRLGGPPRRDQQVFNGSLFYDRIKGPELTAEQLGQFFQRLSKHLGEPITPHRLRHTMATELAAHGDIRTLQELLGHTNIHTTMGYVHPDVDRMRSMLDNLPRL